MNFLEPLLTAAEAARADQFTIRELGISGSELMERAGLAVAKKVEALLGQHEYTLSSVPVVVICGPGNNGGDGWVVARRLWQNGIRAAVITLVNPEQLKNEADIASRQFFAAATNELWTLPDLNPCAQHVENGANIADFLDRFKPTIIVDAIFGTGLKKPAEGLFADAIQALNRHKKSFEIGVHVLAIDLPSGLPSDGQAGSLVHVHADSTIAIQFRKITHLSGPHSLSCGKVTTVDIGIKLDVSPTARALLASNQPPMNLLRSPKASFYKGNYGHVGVLLGSYGLQGASELAAYSALRSGAGLVTLLVLDGTKTETLIAPEIMRAIIKAPLVNDSLDRLTAFVLGPGTGQSHLEIAKEVLTFALANFRPTVVDAGALPLLKGLLKKSPKNRNEIIATPHPGEAARLLNLKTTEIEIDRIGAAKALLKFSTKLPATVTFILKGSNPIVADPEHGLIVCEGGLSTLSVGGSGDVLSGLCAALFAQTDTAFDAALLGVSSHLQAGRLLLERQSRGFLAHEIADEIQKVLFGIG